MTDAPTTTPPPNLPVQLLTSPAVGLISTALLVISAFLTTDGDAPALCWFYNLTALPCPGCGLTRSVTAMTHLAPLDALHFHAFGPLIWAILLITALTGALGRANHATLRRRLLPWQRALGRVTNAILAGFFLYGLARLGAVALDVWSWP